MADPEQVLHVDQDARAVTGQQGLWLGLWLGLWFGL